MSVRSENRWRRRLQSENTAMSDRQREAEAIFMVRSPRRPAEPVKSKSSPSRRQIRAWMRANAAEYETATNLAEAANAAFDLPADWLDDDVHWIWDEAADAMELAGGAA